MRKLFLVLALPFMLAVAACDAPPPEEGGGAGGGAAPADPMSAPE